MDGETGGAVIGSPGKKLTVEMIQKARKAMLESDKRIAMWNDLADQKSRHRVSLDDLAQEARDSFDKFEKGEMLSVTAKEANDILNLAANALNGFGAYDFNPNPKGLKMEAGQWPISVRSPYQLAGVAGMNKNEILRKMLDNMAIRSNPAITVRPAALSTLDEFRRKFPDLAKMLDAAHDEVVNGIAAQRDHHLAVAKDAMAKLACAEANITSLQMEVASLKAQLAALEQPDPPDDDPSTKVHDAIKAMALNNFQLTARAGWHK